MGARHSPKTTIWPPIFFPWRPYVCLIHECCSLSQLHMLCCISSNNSVYWWHDTPVSFSQPTHWVPVCLCGRYCIQRVDTADWWTVDNNGRATRVTSVQRHVSVFHWLYYRRRLLWRRRHVSKDGSTRLSRQVDKLLLLLFLLRRLNLYVWIRIFNWRTILSYVDSCFPT